jgi:hypothetical protein
MKPLLAFFFFSCGYCRIYILSVVFSNRVVPSVNRAGTIKYKCIETCPNVFRLNVKSGSPEYEVLSSMQFAAKRKPGQGQELCAMGFVLIETFSKLERLIRANLSDWSPWKSWNRIAFRGRPLNLFCNSA